MVTSKLNEKIEIELSTLSSASGYCDRNDNAVEKSDLENPSMDPSKKSPSIFSVHSSISSFFDRHMKKYSHCLGMLLAAASGLLLTLYSALYKMVKKDIDNSTVLMLRGIIQVFITMIIIAFSRVNVAPRNMAQKTHCQRIWTWFIFVCVCLIGGFRLCFIFAALERIPMALVHTILNGSPVLVMVLSHFLLKDSCNLLRTFCTFGLVGGVMLVFQPQNFIFANNQQVNSTVGHLTGSNLNETFGKMSLNQTMLQNQTTLLCHNVGNNATTVPGNCMVADSEKLSNDLIGYVFSVGALVLSAFGSVLTKKITQQFDKMVIALYLGISIGVVGWMQLMIFEPKASTSPDTFYPWFVAIIVGCLGVGQQFCLIAALKIESPTRVTVIRSLQIVISFIVQIQAWDERPGVDQIFGVIFVLTAIVIVTLENPIMNRINRCFEACNNKTFTVVADAEEKC